MQHKWVSNYLNDTCKFFANFSVKFARMKNNLYLCIYLAALMLACSWLSLSPMSWYVFSQESIYTDV